MSAIHLRDIEVGERYVIDWRNGQKIAGDVLEVRPIKNSRLNTSSTESAASLELRPQDFEYYIHFPSFDRRLDEWVTADRIDLETIVIDSDETRAKKAQKRKLDDQPSILVSGLSSSEIMNPKKDEKEALLAKLEKEHEEVTKIKNINSIVLGKYEIETWYYSPYPEEYCGEDRLFLCEYCLKYMKKQKTLASHAIECTRHSPPGREIYRESDLSMFEIDGKDHKIYCQNLCLLSKLFLDHKTLYYDVDPFLFYVLCEVDESGAHVVGYFSKEKQSQDNYNLACILTFPPYQRKGYGKFLISISYEITKRENTTGSPEKPLSDLGKISYRSFWAYVILKFFQEYLNTQNLSLNDIAKMTGIRTEDILSTLHALNFIRYWKGQHVIQVSAKEIENQLKQAKKIRLCDPASLTWWPEKAVAAKKSS